LSGDQRTLERMRIEAQTLGQLRHQHIVQITAFGQTRDARPYIVMEYLRGRTLREELVARGPLPLDEALTYGCELLSALGAAHSIGVVHRDIKPDNLFICRLPDGRQLLKVLDFGVAKVTSEVSPIQPLDDQMRTETGAVIGTPRWQSPEGAVGQPVDARADVYAAGLVMYLLLTGRGPFDHFESDSTVLEAHATEAALPPSRYARQPLPPELDFAILKALSKDPVQRYQSAEEFRRDLLELRANSHQRPSRPETYASAPAPAPAEMPLAEVQAASELPSTNLDLNSVSAPAMPARRRTPWLIAFLVFAITGALSAAAVAALQGAP